MALYEHVFLVRQDVSSAQVDTLTDQFKAIIEERGGTIAKREYWGVKSLSFRIKKNRKAHYSLLNIDAEHDAVAEMERQMHLNEDVIRFMTLRVKEHEESPSAMVRSRGGRDDRRGPRGDSRPPRPQATETASSEGKAEKASEEASS